VRKSLESPFLAFRYGSNVPHAECIHRSNRRLPMCPWNCRGSEQFFSFRMLENCLWRVDIYVRNYEKISGLNTALALICCRVCVYTVVIVSLVCHSDLNSVAALNFCAPHPSCPPPMHTYCNLLYTNLDSRKKNQYKHWGFVTYYALILHVFLDMLGCT
jgi:hypothetical protein